MPSASLSRQRPPSTQRDPFPQDSLKLRPSSRDVYTQTWVCYLPLASSSPTAPRPTLSSAVESSPEPVHAVGACPYAPTSSVCTDLFRYAVHIFPYLPSELLGDCFELAVAARVLDMRASPYDLRHAPTDPGLDLSPIKIETGVGRSACHGPHAGWNISWTEPRLSAVRWTRRVRLISRDFFLTCFFIC